MYASTGRPSIPPERVLKATLLMALYTVRSERLLCEQLDYNLLFRWFLDMDMVEESFVATVFTKNRERLLAHDVAGRFLGAVVEQARNAGLMSNEHFTVDGTLIEAWASRASGRRAPTTRRHRTILENPTVNFRGEKRSNETHESSTDPDARLARKGDGKEAKLAYSAHALMENRHGLLVGLQVDVADGHAERRSAIELLDEHLPGKRRITVGGDKGYDTSDFLADLRERNATPHVAQQITKYRGSKIDRRTTRHVGYAISQRIRKRVEEAFGWFKTVGNFRKTRYRGIAVNQLAAHMLGAAYNLLRIAKLISLGAS